MWVNADAGSISLKVLMIQWLGDADQQTSMSVKGPVVGTHNPLVVGSSPTRPTTHAALPVSSY